MFLVGTGKYSVGILCIHRLFQYRFRVRLRWSVLVGQWRVSFSERDVHPDLYGVRWNWLGYVTILESTIRQGTGSLASGTTGSAAVTTKFVENFIYGTPFTITLSAFASGNFIGAYCDGGSLLVRKTIDSISFTDQAGVIRNVAPSAAAQTLSPTPEPAGWVLALLGVGLVIVARAKLPRREASQNQSKASEQGSGPRWTVGDGDLG